MNKKKENDKLNRWSEPLKEKYFCFAKDFVKSCYIINTELKGVLVNSNSVVLIHLSELHLSNTNNLCTINE